MTAVINKLQKKPTKAWLKADEKRTAMNKGRFKIVSDDYSATIFTCDNDKGKPVALFYKGRQLKPTKAYFYQTEELRAAEIEKFIEECSKQASRIKNKNSNADIELGQVFYSSWGYDQTNIDFYKVLKKIGTTMIEIVEIGQFKKYEDQDIGTCLPDIDTVIGVPMRKKVSNLGTRTSIRISSFQSAWLLDKNEDGSYKSKDWTAYR
jgi:hypothetical protein